LDARSVACLVLIASRWIRQIGQALPEDEITATEGGGGVEFG
jgi:hypothetical protein